MSKLLRMLIFCMLKLVSTTIAFYSIALFTGTQWPTEIVKRYKAAKLNAVLMQLSLLILKWSPYMGLYLIL